MKFSKLSLLFLLFAGYAQVAHADSQTDRIELAGDILQIAIPVVALGLSVSARDWTGVKQFSVSYLSSMALTGILKVAIQAERPNGGNYSMPSGHTASAFAGASFAQRRYGWAFGVPLYVGAAFTGYSRVRSDHHHTRDVLVGAGIAMASSLLFVSRVPRDFKFAPSFDGAKYWLNIQMDFAPNTPVICTKRMQARQKLGAKIFCP